MVITTPDDDSLRAVGSGGPRFQQMSVRGPALIVLGIAVFIIVLGVVASALSSGSTPTLTLHTVTISGGTVVDLTPATQAMKSIVSAGQPPADILGNLAIPADSPVTRTINIDQNSEQFDRTVAFTNGLPPQQLVAAFRAIFTKLKWDVIYAGNGASRQAGAQEVLAKRASGDGFYWETGVVVSPATAAGTTPFTVELLELPDDD
jgi:hypothetical protein